MWKETILKCLIFHLFLQNSGIGSLVEPMIWVYVEDVDRFVDSVTWASYSQVFEHVWSASAFKGAFGERMFSVNIQRHAANQVTMAKNQLLLQYFSLKK